MEQKYKTNISYASKKDLEKILKLWNICFPESSEFTKWYFKNVISPENTLIYRDNDNQIISMLQEIPVEFSSFGKATYIYGACTHPLYRKKGIMAELLKMSFENDVKKGINISILIPENEELFNFYKKFGYNKTTLIKKEYFKNNESLPEYNKKYIFRKALYSDIENMNTLYSNTLSGYAVISRNREFWENQIKMFSEIGGGCFCLYNKENLQLEAYAFLWNEEKIIAQEICFTDNFAKDAFCKCILSELNPDKPLILNVYDNSGDYKACIKFHNHSLKNENNLQDYIINLLWN